MKRVWWLALWGVMVSNAFGQQSIISKSSVENRTRIIRELPEDPDKVAAEGYAREYNLDIRRIDTKGKVFEIQRLAEGRHPLYNETHNLDAARTVSTLPVREGAVGGFHLHGKNILVAIWEGGKIRTTHDEFGSRAYSLDSGYEIIGHSTHVAGTIGAAGLDPDATGMADQCFIEGYDWDNDWEEMRQAAGDGLLLSNHSYGYVHGFSYNEDERRWEWYGDYTVDEQEDYNFGFYSRETRSWDDVAYQNPYYLIVKSAGNDRLEGPSPGSPHYIINGDWELSTTVRNKDGGPDGFDCIGTRATAKNILTVGAIGDLEEGFVDPEEVEITDFSTFGPTDDGRIKPDIVANGTTLYSTYNRSDEDYSFLSGTSMSAPNATGSLALLQELYFMKHSSYMRAATLKGIALHSADDVGNPGPDYKFGWGVLNTLTAARLINHDPNLLIEDSISEESVRRFTFFAPGDSGIKVTLCWTDPRGPIVPVSVDPSMQILINDLDMRLIRQKDSMVYEPYVLDPAQPEAPAITGDNFRDNIEQIALSNAESGYYELIISHKESLRNGLQHFSLIVEGLGSIYLADDTTFLNGNNGFLQVTDAPEYPANRSFIWYVEPENQQPVNLYFDLFRTNNTDTLYVFDGSGRDFPLLAQFSGSLLNPDTVLNAISGSIFLEFRSGSEAGYPGFSARYCTSPPVETITIRGEEYPCFGTEEVYFFEPRPESTYGWSYSENITGTIEVTPTSVAVQVPDQLYTLTVTPENKCGTGVSSTRTIVPVTAPPVILPEITGDTLPCISQPNLFSVENEPSANYWWTLPKGWSGQSDSASIWVTPLEETGTISVIPSNSCGESEKIELSVHPESLPEPPVIESNRINPCELEIQQFSVQPDEETSYEWRAERGWEILGPDSLSEVSVMVGTGNSGRMYLTASNRCGGTLTSRNFQLAQAPTVPYLRKQPSSIEGLDELLVLNYTDYTTVKWFRNDELYEGFHEESLILHRNGTYSIEVVNDEGCTAAMKDDLKVEIEDRELLYSISTASEGIVRVQNDAPDPAYMQVFDLTGRMAFAEELLPGTRTFHTHRRGLLIIRIEGDTHVKTEMIFVH
jgi:subtilisin family serine protease